MEFGSNKEGFCEEDQVSNKVKLHNYFSYASSSSSSHHQCKTQQLLPVLNNISRWEREETNTTHQIYDDHQQQIYSNEETAVAASTTSPRNSEDYVRSASVVGIEKEHMFDKVVTPSDVGKLNRLVIPKQHAEKYFPLDSSTNEKGLLLNFEDRNGKPWRFRYSYWNSSQSYVMTKGWSRFVKDKKLDAGDVVSFQRGVGELGKDRLFIDWRRRPDASDPATTSFPLHQHQLPFHPSIPWNPLMVMRPQVLPPMARDHSQSNNFYNRNSYYNGSSYGSSTTAMSPCYGSSTNVMSPRSMGSVFYWRSQPAAATSVHPQPHMGMVEWQRQQQHQLQQQQHPIVFDSVPVVQGQAAAKRLRLFGVNMDCPVTESDECDILSSTMASQPSQLSSSSQLRLYNGTPMPAALPPIDFLNKGKASMSFDSGI